MGTYASLILFGDELEVNAENIQKLLKAANVNVETYWPGLFGQLIKDRRVTSLLTDACKGGGGGGPQVAKVDDQDIGKKVDVEDQDKTSDPEPASSDEGPTLFALDDSSDESSSDDEE